MNGIPQIRTALSRVYTQLKGERAVPRNIEYDSDGPLALIGTQGTNEVWYAERISIDSENDIHTFRVLLIRPTKTKGVQMNRRTGQPEFGTRLTSCQYIVGDVEISAFNGKPALGTVLKNIQEEFRYVRRNPIDTGQIRGNNDTHRIVNRLFTSSQ